MARSIIEWFVEPTGDVARANQVFAHELGPAEEFAGEQRDDMKILRKVWTCTSFAQVRQFWQSRQTLGITFDVWNREHNYGPIRYVTFLMPRRSRPAKISTLKAKAVVS
jgi:hypothetical protein